MRAGLSDALGYRPAYRVMVDSRDVLMPGALFAARVYRWLIVGPRRDWSQWSDTLDQCHATLHAAMRGMLRLDRLTRA